MKIVVAADHRGFKLKEKIKEILKEKGHKILDAGPGSEKRTDYPLYARKAMDILKENEAVKGILICGSGLGMCIAANKIKGIRAVTARQPSDAEMARRHNDANVLCLGADRTGLSESADIINVFLHTEFEGGRHQRRLDIIKGIEDACC